MAEYDDAVALAEKVGDAVLGTAVSDLTNEALSALGLGGVDQSDKYYDQVKQSLAALRVDIDQLGARLTTVVGQLTAVQAALTSISMDVEDAELQTALQAYIGDASLIEQNFQTYTAALASMADASSVSAALVDLFQLFAVNNVDAVAEAMRDVHKRFVGDSELKGIASFQPMVCQNEFDAWASNGNNLLFNTSPFNVWNPQLVPTGDAIWRQWYTKYDDAISAKVVPTFKAVLALQLKGLLFLTAAWGKTFLESNLTVQVKNVKETITAMGSWWSGANPDAAVSAVLQARGPRLASDALAATWYDATNNSAVTSPFDSTWVFWVLPAIDGSRFHILCAVQQPWNYGTCALGYFIMNEPMQAEIGGSWVNFTYQYFSNPSTTEIARPSTSMPAVAPASLTTFLATISA